MASSVTVRPVLTPSDRKRFINFPYRLYADNPHWVAPLRIDQKHTLDPSKNAFFDHGQMQLFLAEDATGKILGRIAAIVNGMHLSTYEDATGFFGFFETVEDYSVAEALFEQASAWLRGQGLSHMCGPTNPSLNDTAGLLTQGFDRRPSLLMPYNPPYYQDFLETYGFGRVMTMWAYYIHQKYLTLDRLTRGVRLVRKRHPTLSVRPIDMSRFDKEAAAIRDIYNDAWAKNWGHVPITNAEFAQLAEEMKKIIDPAIALLLELDGQPVAFSVTLPDINEVLQHVHDGRLFPFGLAKLLLYTNLFNISSSRMALMGVRQVHQGKGLGGVLIHETIERGLALNYLECELGWVLDSNSVMKNAIESIGGIKDKQYGLFKTQI